ncbi:MAG TPA: hypothetical protein VGW58_03600 [Pyrinomonadaceae bacterium]|nr:hypothetical protein [Pyrinomonadaceae bacterium]
MKTCPKCNRTFPDEGQKFCTFDGGLLIAPQTFDPNATIRATSIDLNAPSERPTSRDLPDQNATIIEQYPATVALPRNTGPTGHPTTTSGPDTADFSKPAQPSPTPPPAPPAPPPPAPPVEAVVAAPTPAAPAVSASLPPPVLQPAPSAPLPPPAAKKKSKLPWIIAGVLLFLLLGGGAIAAAFFLVVKPRLDQMAVEHERIENRPVVVTNTNTATPEPTIEQPSPTPADTFVPPPNTVQFTNAKDKLDGVLAQHYFDFSFYYPQSWQTDPKAGVPGATNFVKVERRIPPDFTQENFVVKWYQSTGTFVGDLQSFPQRVEEFSASLAKAFPEYAKVSEGPTKVNSMDAYEFRWQGLSKGTEKGDLKLWGRVIFLPTGHEGDTSGAILSMFTTSLAPELSSVEDVGTKGEAPVILDSFRFGKK